MLLARNNGIFVVRLPPSPPNLMKLPPFFVQRCTMNGGTFMLITRETKLKIVKKHLKDGVTLRELSEQFHIHRLCQ